MPLKNRKDAKDTKSSARSIREQFDDLIKSLQKATNLTIKKLYTISYSIGSKSIEFVHHCNHSLISFIKDLKNKKIVHHENKTSFISKLKLFFSNAFVAPKNHFVSCKNHFIACKEKISSARKNGAKTLLSAIGSVLADSFIGFVKFLWGSLSYILPVASIAALIFVINFFNGLNFAVSIEYNGEKLGYIPEEGVFSEAQDIMQSRLVSQTDARSIKTTPVYTLAIVKEDELLSAPALSDKLIKSSGNVIMEATGLYVDGKLIGATADEKGLEAELDAFLSKYSTGAEDEKIEFVADVSLQSGLYPVESVVDLEDITSIINSQKSVERTYTAVEGDCASVIADKNDVPLKDLIALNPDIETKLHVGDKVLVAKAAPYLSVKVTKNETYEESIPFKTETTLSKSYYKGYTKVKVAGKNGVQQVNANVTYVDGIPVSRDVLSTKVLQEPVDKQVIEGSLTNSYTPNRGQATVTGRLGWPVAAGGSVSCGYLGYRGHYALDITYGYGAAIVAADGGVVEVAQSGWNSGYGKYIIINHGNGIKTLYAHNSALHVRPGQRVNKGDKIASMGATGRVTGTHLHFEVIVNGRKQNPWNYLK